MHLLIKPLKKIQKQLNALADLDYETVMQTKSDAAKELFNEVKSSLTDDPEFIEFFESE